MIERHWRLVLSGGDDRDMLPMTAYEAWKVYKEEGVQLIWVDRLLKADGKTRLLDEWRMDTIENLDYNARPNRIPLSTNPNLFECPACFCVVTDMSAHAERCMWA